MNEPIIAYFLGVLLGSTIFALIASFIQREQSKIIARLEKDLKNANDKYERYVLRIR